MTSGCRPERQAEIERDGAQVQEAVVTGLRRLHQLDDKAAERVRWLDREIAIHDERQATSEVKEEESYRSETFKARSSAVSHCRMERLRTRSGVRVLEIVIPRPQRHRPKRKPRTILVKAVVPAKV